MRANSWVRFAVIAALSVQLALPSQAHAGVGVAGLGAGVPAAVALVALGGSGVAAGLGVVIYACALDHGASPIEYFFGCALIGGFGLGLSAVGLVILPDRAELAFGQLSDSGAVRLGLSEREITAYRSELDEINAIRQEVVVRLSRMETPSVEDGRALWLEYRDSLSPDAFAALEKVSSGIARSAVEKSAR
jgi:hypothetical protein